MKTQSTKYHIATCSFGKDSLAMILLLIEKGMPLDEVVFYNSGMEFQSIYNLRDKLLPMFEEQGLKYTELHPDRPFIYDMFDKPVYSKKNGHHYGYGWCGGACRWGTQFKITSLTEYKKSIGREVIEYIGIAVDEPARIRDKTYPLVEWKMTEHDCLQYCYQHGYSWDENGVELYSILDRVSCWCCRNKNRKELKNIYRYLPFYWEKLKSLQSKLDKPMKRFCTKEHGEYGNVFAMEKVFEEELR